MRCICKNTTQRYKSLTGFEIFFAYLAVSEIYKTRYKAVPCDMPFGREKRIYIISRLPIGKHIAFYKVKYIELQSNISQSIIKRCP